MVPVEDRRELAESLSTVKSPVDTQPPVVWKLRVQILDLINQRLLDTNDIRRQPPDRVHHKRFSKRP